MSELHDELGPLLAGMAAIGLGVSVTASVSIDFTPPERDPLEPVPPGRTDGEPIREPRVSAEATEAAVLNLTQGIVSGSLQGDELRAVIENDPGLARALCRGLAQLSGFKKDTILVFEDLREFGAGGMLTSDHVVAALVAALRPE